MKRFLDKYIIYYADRWETNHRLTHALVGLSLYAIQLLYFVWSILVIPVIIYMAVTLSQERVLLAEKEAHIATQLKFIKHQNARIDSLESVQELALRYKGAVEDYYNEVLKSRGVTPIKIESKRTGKNSFELVIPPS